MPLSGREWVERYPTSRNVSDLVEPFRAAVTKWLNALKAAGATVTIDATFRPPERAYLMHYSFRIAREGLDPTQVPAYQGVDIQWVHKDGQGQADVAASRTAAGQMVEAFGVVFKPVLASRHTQGRAIDMTIAWKGPLTIVDAKGQRVTISSTPRTGADNPALHRVGASYGVIKLATDAPHWSSDGH